MIQHEPAGRPTAKEILMAAPSIVLELRNMYGFGPLPHSLSQTLMPSQLNSGPRGPRKKSNSNQSSPLLSPKIVLLPGARKKNRGNHGSTKLSPELVPLTPAPDEATSSNEDLSMGTGCHRAHGKSNDSSGSRGKRLPPRISRRACTFSGLRARHVPGLSWRKTLYRRGWLAGLSSARALWGSETCQF